MTYCNPFLQFNFSPAFSIGNYIGSCLSQRLFGGFGMQTSPFGNQNTIFYNNCMNFPAFNLNNSIFNIGNFYMPQQHSFNPGFNLNFNMSNWNFAIPSFTFSMQSINSSTSSVGSPKKTGVSLDGYNAEKGEKLARIAKSNTKILYNTDRIKMGAKRSSEFTHSCARYVSIDIQEAGLGNIKGHGFQMAGLLRRNPNFKEIAVSGTDWKNLPAGAILCYNKGSQNYSAEHGHVEISVGDGTAVSDGTTRNIRKPDAIFIPV